MGKTSKRKSKKSADSNRSCSTCFFGHEIGDGNFICSKDGKEVLPEYSCKSFDSTSVVRCDRCHKEVTYKDKQEFYNAFVTFYIQTHADSSISQKLHLCRKCQIESFNMFEDFLEKVREYTPYIEENNEK